MEVAFAPGFGGGLGELPVVEAGAEAGSDGLGLSGSVVVAQAVVGQAERFGEQPALAVVLRAERLDPPLHVPAARRDRGDRSGRWFGAGGW